MNNSDNVNSANGTSNASNVNSVKNNSPGIMRGDRRKFSLAAVILLCFILCFLPSLAACSAHDAGSGDTSVSTDTEAAEEGLGAEAAQEGTGMDAADDVSDMDGSVGKSEEKSEEKQQRAYQNPPEYVQISNEISTHGLDYYTSPVLVDDNSTKEDHIEALIETAYKYEGDDFVYNQSGPPGEGVDCSGLLMQACYGAGVDLWPCNPARHREKEHSWESRVMAEMDTLKTVPYEDRQRGDLIFFTGPDGLVFHCAIYLGDNRIIHSTVVGEKVVVTGMGGGTYGEVYRVKRIFN